MHVFYTMRIETGPFCEIGGLVVDEGERGKGAGRALIEKAIEWSRTRDVATLRVRSNTIRTEAHIFYRKMAFEEVKEQKIFPVEVEFMMPEASDRILRRLVDPFRLRE